MHFDEISGVSGCGIMNGVWVVWVLCISCLCEQFFVGMNSNLASFLLGCCLCLNLLGVLSDLHYWVAGIGLVWFGLAVDFEIGLIWVAVSVGLWEF